MIKLKDLLISSKYDFSASYIFETRLDDILMEALIKSYSKKKLVDELNHYQVNDEYTTFEALINDSGDVNVSLKNNWCIDHIINHIKQTCKLFGYIISADFCDQYKYGTKYIESDVRLRLGNGEKIIIRLEPIFDSPVNIPQYVYHVTPKLYVSKILKTGLKPTTKNKLAFHPERIYVITVYDPQLIKKFINNMKVQYSNHFMNLKRKGKKINLKKDDLDFILLKIDTSKIKDLKLYMDPMDPNFKNVGAFTNNNIPKESIAKIMTENEII